MAYTQLSLEERHYIELQLKREFRKTRLPKRWNDIRAPSPESSAPIPDNEVSVLNVSFSVSSCGVDLHLTLN